MALKNMTAQQMVNIRYDIYTNIELVKLSIAKGVLQNYPVIRNSVTGDCIFTCQELPAIVNDIGSILSKDDREIDVANYLHYIISLGYSKFGMFLDYRDIAVAGTSVESWVHLNATIYNPYPKNVDEVFGEISKIALGSELDIVLKNHSLMVLDALLDDIAIEKMKT